MTIVPTLIPTRPIPTAVCLGCRTATPAAERCDCGDSRIVDVRKSRGRALLRREVWGSDERQGRLRRVGTESIVGTVLGALVIVAATLAADEYVGVFEAVVSVGVAALLGGAAIAAVHRHNRRARQKALRPSGVRATPALAPIGGGVRSRLGVAQGETFPSPLGAEACLAFEISLRADNPRASGADLVWREAATRGFTVRLDDGELVRIPAGPIRLSRAPDSARASHADACKRLLPELGSDDVGLPCVPPAAAFEQLVRPGARVAVLGPLEPREDSGASQPRDSLRALARMVLVPAGTPVLALQDA